jgi:hypothetical protein
MGTGVRAWTSLGILLPKAFLCNFAYICLSVQIAEHHAVSLPRFPVLTHRASQFHPAVLPCYSCGAQSCPFQAGHSSPLSCAWMTDGVHVSCRCCRSWAMGGVPARLWVFHFW